MLERIVSRPEKSAAGFRVPESHVRGLSDNDMRWLAARVLIALEDTRKFGGMSVHELKQALKSIPGSDSLTLAYAPNGNELVTIAGRTVEVSPTASNAEIVLAFSSPEPVSTGNVTFVQPAAASVTAPSQMPAATPIPPVTMNAAKTNQPPTGKTTTMSITGAAPAAMSIKDLIAKSRTTVQAAHQKLITNAGKVQDAAAALDGLGDDLGKEGDDLMAMIGQFKNDLSGASSA